MRAPAGGEEEERQRPALIPCGDGRGSEERERERGRVSITHERVLQV